jgi:MerR HTH family regulatory protein
MNPKSPQRTPEATPPCHKLPHSQWCDRKGPGDFMGHTCFKERTYSSNDIADITGASLRQLQWWDEQRLIQPKHFGHRREYSEAQMLEAKVVMELRQKSYSLQAIRVVFRSIQRTWKAESVGHVIHENPGAFLLAMQKRGEVVIEPEMVIRVCADSRVPVVLIELPGDAKILPPAKNGKTRR